MAIIPDCLSGEAGSNPVVSAKSMHESQISDGTVV